MKVERQHKNMNSRIKKMWLKALRSGKYKQARRAMMSNFGGETKYCCLGVLADLYEKDTGKKCRQLNENSDYPKASVAKWAGIDPRRGFAGMICDPYVTVAGEETTLSKLNDEKTKSFKQIANVIEKHL